MSIGYENASNKEVRSTVHFTGFGKPMISHLGYEKPVKLCNCHFIGVEMSMIFTSTQRALRNIFGAMYFIGLSLPVAHALHMLTRQLHHFKLKSG